MRGQPRLLSATELALEAGSDTSYVQELVAAGLLKPDAEGRHDPDDVSRVKLARTMATAGISVDDLAWSVLAGTLAPRDIPRIGPVSVPSGRTFEQFAASLGPHSPLLPSIYAAFGLAVPSAETVMQQAEEDAIRGFIGLWSIVDDRAEVYLRAARIVGDGIRHVQLATIDLFDEVEGSPPQRLRKGLSLEDAVEPSIRLNASMEQLLVWLFHRHAEHEIFSRIVAFIEGGLAEAGRVPLRRADPEAIAFVDLAGYTERTAAIGDDRAAQEATVLQALAHEVAIAHGGRVVKLLGDGVMLRFPGLGAAVTATEALLPRIVAAGLPAAHAGIAAGPIVIRDGDVYGHTVNLAARIAGVSEPDEILVAWDGTVDAATVGVPLEPAGERTLKGIGGPVAVARAVRSSAERPRAAG